MMLPASLFAWVIAFALVAMIVGSAVRILFEYERGVVFRLGRYVGVKGPGLRFIIPLVDRLVKISLRTVAMDVPPQDVITKDNVSIKVSAVLYFRVMSSGESLDRGGELPLRYQSAGADLVAQRSRAVGAG